MNTTEHRFAYKVRQALNENIDDLPASTKDRLASARKLALARKKQASGLRLFARRGVLAGHAALHEPLPWLGRMGVALPVLLVVAGLVGIYHHEQQQRIQDLAELDAQVLADELPLDAYLDHGFNAYLNKRAIR